MLQIVLPSLQLITVSCVMMPLEKITLPSMHDKTEVKMIYKVVFKRKIIAVSIAVSIFSATQSLAQELSREEFDSLSDRVRTLESENANLRNAEGARNVFSSLVGTNAEYSFKVLDHAEMTNTKQLYQLQALSNGMLGSKLTLGGQVTALVNYQDANENSKFGWLMRHPTSANQIGTSSSEAVIHSSNINLTAKLHENITGYVELLYNPEQNFASGSTITGLPRNNVNVRRAYVLWGNLDKSPMYASLGKMDIPFGWNDTVSPFTNSTSWHSFAGLAYGGLFGYANENLHLRAMAIQGGAQFRNANTPVEGTNVPSKLNNFAADANYTFAFESDATLNLGASYQYGSSYCQEFQDTPAEAHSTGATLIPGVTRNTAPQGVRHFNSCNDNVDAVAAYGIYTNSKLMLTAEYATTLDVWPGTANPYIPQFAAEKNETFTLGGRYSSDVGFPEPIDFSVEFSRFNAGSSGSPWEKQDQLVLGASYYLSPGVNLFAELIRVEGWVPLNFLSGGNPGSLVGTSWSSQTSKNNIFALGIQAAF